MSAAKVTHAVMPKVAVDPAVPTPAPEVEVRTARPGDEREICRLVNAWADEGLMLRRTEAEVSRHLGEFVLAEQDGRAIGCGALNVFSPSLAEIRSVAVDQTVKASGVGRQIMLFLVDMARALEVDEVVLLTKVPGFFAKFGFRAITPEMLPAAFLEEAIVGRGRTVIGRTIMIREVSW